MAISKDTPKQTEARFKKEERARDGAEAMLEYEAEGRAVRTVAISKDTPKQTEARFKKEERARDGAEAMLEYEAEGRAVRERTARLKALRLAAEAGNKDAAIRAAPKPAKRAVKKAATKSKGAPAQP